MYGQKGLNNFYRFDKVGYNNASEKQARGYAQFLKGISKECLNDNPIIRIVYGIGEKLSVLRSDMDIVLNPNYPDEVKSVINSLQRKFPTYPGFQCDSDEVFDFIADRYSQFGEEIDATVDSFVSELKSLSTPPVVNNIDTGKEE